MQPFLSPNEKAALDKLKSDISSKYNLLEMKLYGSKARGDHDSESDIDVLIVLDTLDWATEKDVYELCFTTGLAYDVLIAPMVYSKNEMASNLVKATPFYLTVQKEGIAL
ncbi:MAG: nucleotidyltransferase domain-containing protein [Pseudomonadota bacterium]